ncbi:transposase [Dysgonomonas termitidis]|uniref:Transposase n=1 Tax=Dysgonomonas termitidis TaxID=1516126 RepID=A0ABV9KSI0_9BACT
MQKYNLFYFFKQFPDELACRKYLEQRFWKGNTVCPHSGNSQKIYRYKNGKTLNVPAVRNNFKLRQAQFMRTRTYHCRNGFLLSI